MKKRFLASALTVGLLAISGPAFASMMGHAAYGDMVEMKVGDHMMHVQLVEDSEGQWVFMSRAEAEQVFGPLDKAQWRHSK
jgi:hypothetical protein